MANRLKKLRVTSVDMVRAGANQEADICLYKSADPEEAPEHPTEAEHNILKRFIRWIMESTAEDDAEDESTVEKDYSTFGSLNARRESNEKLWQYTSALTESIRSIQEDHDLDKEEKLEMMQQSLGEFNTAMEKLLKTLCCVTPTGGAPVMAKSAPEDEPEDMSYLFEDMEKSYSEEEEDEEDEIEEVEKYNHNHDALGRFASSAAGTGGRASTSGKPAFASTKPKFNGNGLAKITVYRGTMGKDWTEEKLTINGGSAVKTKDSVSYEGMDRAKNTYTVKYRLGSDGNVDYSRCDVIEKSADVVEIEEV